MAAIEQGAAPTYSFVIPVMNEEPVISELYRRLSSVAGQLDGDAEFLFVDDGSDDRSRDELVLLRQTDERVKVLALSRNFGHQLAITAGIDFAEGDAVVIMDADLQDPPEVALELATRWREGYDVVHAVRRSRKGETRFKRSTARLFYRLLNKISDVEMPLDAGDFRLVDRRVADAVRSMREPNRYLRGLFAWVGFRQATVPYERDERAAGETKYSLLRMIHFASNGVIGFSTVPLRLALTLGFAMSVAAFAVGVAALLVKVTGGFTIPGWASLAVLISFFSGVQLTLLGAVGQYVGRNYEQGKDRPLYLVDERFGLEESGTERIVRTAVVPRRRASAG
jgi:glycosyltransferase involved in cell wall biosynthesis